jgi:hypothetical protein
VATVETATINCPNCTALLKISGSLRPGKSVRCPQCHFTFRLPHEPAPTSPRAVNLAPPEMQAPAESPPEERSYKLGKEVTYKQEEAPRVRPRRFRPERHRMPMPWIPWAVAGLVSLSVLGVITIVVVAV